jgi:NTP pyrophosphatase (non-canonical NTP hydrolase)
LRIRIMELSEYQQQALTTAVYPRRKNNFPYAALGLNGEAGEVAEHAKKMIRDDEGQLTDERREKIRKELGDVLWYIAAAADEAGLDLDDIAQVNLDKLFSRKERGVIHGAGDER